MSKVVSGVSNVLNQKLVQISITGSILFYIVASPFLFDLVKNLVSKLLGLFGIQFELDGMQLVLFHSVVFGVLLYFSSKYILKHVVEMVKKK